MKNEFVPYDIALALRDLGFDEDVMATYYRKKLGYIKDSIKGGAMPNLPYPKYVKAPLYQQAFRWFREEHELYGSVEYKDDLKSEWGGSAKGYYETWGKYDLGFTGWFKTYEEAQDACLRKLIEIVKENKDE